ncbi:hypothetical protein ACH5RR_013975 [Cinchona calisaya]|uniref:Cyclin-like domain-containing protein n=1 Tax=Cinchona calisaya TaxID=153742 RepID=A0ABD3A7D7_9GENT
MEISHYTSSYLPSLLCEEDESCFGLNNNSDEYWCECCVFEHDDEYIEERIKKESKFQLDDNVSSIDISVKQPELCWLKRARLDAIRWILDTRVLFGFHFQTVYLSLAYFDGFFSKRSIEDGKIWAIRLLSIACLSLAAKMEEYEAPALSEYHVDEYDFEGRVIQKMELLVLETLDWKMNIITPFDYFGYFIAKFSDESRPKGLISRSIELILAILKDIDLVKYPPSIIAAVAVLAACDSQFTTKTVEYEMSLISSWGSSHKIFAFCFDGKNEFMYPSSSLGMLPLPSKRLRKSHEW